MKLSWTMLERGSFRCLLFWGALCLVFSTLSPHFLSFTNFDNVLSASAVTGLLALGATFVIGNGEIDLSVASVMALSGTVAAFFIQGTTHGPVVALMISCMVGSACGLLTGFLLNVTRAPSFIVTLGMLSIARAIAYIVSEGTPIYGLPSAVTAAGQGRWFGMSIPAVLLMVLTVYAHGVLRWSVFGSQVLLHGDNASAAEALGVNGKALRLKIFTLSGFFSGIAGFVFMARTNAGDPTAGQNYELVAITAVILGGTNLFGGQASILGTLLGVLCLGVLQNGLNLLAVSTYYQVLFVGLVLISAALLERFGRER